MNHPADHPFPRRLVLAACAAVVVSITAACGGGGGGEALTAAPPEVPAIAPIGAAELAVLSIEGDADSEAIARAYQQARGIPEANMIRVPLPAVGDAISADAFANLKANVDAKLPAGVQATLVTWMQPSRVAGPSGDCDMSLTSALAFGYDAKYCGQCKGTAVSPYYDSASHRPWTDLRMRPSMMLGAYTLADAQALIARGLGAGGSFNPGRTSGTGWLVRTDDPARSVRYDDFRAAAATPVTGVTMNYIDNSVPVRSNYISGEGAVMFYFTSLARVEQITTNRYLPGAVADHLTSFGGRLPDALGQMPATDWLRAGVTGSYGTVEEPCAFTEKFPRVSILTKRYQGGDVLIEAYWKSVRTPGQGLFLGDPLSRPWVR